MDFFTDDEDDQQDVPFCWDEDDAAIIDDDDTEDHEEEWEGSKLIKFRDETNVLTGPQQIQRQEVATEDKAENVQLPLRWCEMTSIKTFQEIHDPDFPSLGQAMKTSNKRFKRISGEGKNDPNIRILIVNPHSPETPTRERQTKGYGPYEVVMNKSPRDRKMCPAIVMGKSSCTKKNCHLQHDISRWCLKEREGGVCSHTKCPNDHKIGSKQVAKMCNATVAGMVCKKPACDFVHEKKKWCDKDQKKQLCEKNCDLIHHHYAKRPFRIILCGQKEKCRNRQCRFAHSAQQQWQNAPQCSTTACKNAKCFRRHEGETVEQYQIRLKM